MTSNRTADFQKAWDKYAQSTKNHCLALTKNRWEAEDLYHDTWLKAWSHWHKAGLTRLTNAYFTTIAKHTFIDRCRKTKRQPSQKPLVEGSAAMFNAGSDIDYLLKPLVSSLTVKQLGMFLLADVYKWPLKDIAQACQQSLGSVKATLFRARQNVSKHVRGHLEKDWQLADEQALHVQLLVKALTEENTALIVQLVNETVPASVLYSKDMKMQTPAPQALAA
ncbi:MULTISPECIES: RNA polymerase sigma factor [Shouchella]|uniref:RNA polymerase sigma factor n=1 Tax=Shouchella TaxID=2893057 RepID=UPI00090FD808|nr:MULTISPECIES: sigma-70 family RNA polymerase sigma factor [Shouchella]MDO7285871.1 sigma-70 family RNA polymerase sigma factor [Shouchella clausii]MDO7305775.1 sigma-70 family RNA polymerase sigma factor [Shouchella clausii]SHM05033.1 RNA polymerase sigma-70 factor, ECF subfamily [Shouchella rhizosphaerae]